METGRWSDHLEKHRSSCDQRTNEGLQDSARHMMPLVTVAGPWWLHLQCFLYWVLCGKGEVHVRETHMKRDGKGKELSPVPIGLLTFAFSVSDHRVSGINRLRAKSTSTQPQFWQTELSLCGLVCLWPSLSAGQVVTSLSPWNLWARFPKHLPTLSIAWNWSINIYLKLESLSTGKMYGDYMSLPQCMLQRMTTWDTGQRWAST